MSCTYYPVACNCRQDEKGGLSFEFDRILKETESFHFCFIFHFPPSLPSTMVKVAIVYYSLYGHVRTMADAVKEGVLDAGVECDIFQVAETLPEEVLTKMHAPPKADHPVITPEKLSEYDGFIFGVSGRYGSIPSQMKAFFDSTGSLWRSGALVGKPCACFQSTGSQCGGQESIALTGILPYATHHGMIFVPLGYRNPAMFSFDEIHGSSPWGAGTYVSLLRFCNILRYSLSNPNG
jgi:NAD(P)H dehydrogenase (quinone)